jgi:hypothetical protein
MAVALALREVAFCLTAAFCFLETIAAARPLSTFSRRCASMPLKRCRAGFAAISCSACTTEPEPIAVSNFKPLEQALELPATNGGDIALPPFSQLRGCYRFVRLCSDCLCGDRVH